jgi:hypothetical protein
MALNTEWLKAHWYYIAGGLIGLFVVYEIIQGLSASGSGTSATSTDVSGGANQLQALQASADLTDAQVNGQVTTASYAANVADNQTAAALQLGEVQTAAEEDVTNQQTSAAERVALGTAADAVQAQDLVTQGQVQETEIEGNTLDTLASTAGETETNIAKIQASVPLAEIAETSSQVSNLMQYSKNFGSDIQKIAPVIAEETGQGSSAGSVKPSASTTQNPVTTAAASGIGSGISSILSGLFE